MTALHKVVGRLIWEELVDKCHSRFTNWNLFPLYKDSVNSKLVHRQINTMVIVDGSTTRFNEQK